MVWIRNTAPATLNTYMWRYTPPLESYMFSMDILPLGRVGLEQKGGQGQEGRSYQS